MYCDWGKRYNITYPLDLVTKSWKTLKIVGYVAVMIYVMDTIDKFMMARTPRARYVWTTPNMPE